jgi:hypothetical protein
MQSPPSKFNAKLNNNIISSTKPTNVSEELSSPTKSIIKKPIPVPVHIPVPVEKLYTNSQLYTNNTPTGPPTPNPSSPSVLKLSDGDESRLEHSGVEINSPPRQHDNFKPLAVSEFKPNYREDESSAYTKKSAQSAVTESSNIETDSFFKIDKDQKRLKNKHYNKKYSKHSPIIHGNTITNEEKKLMGIPYYDKPDDSNRRPVQGLFKSFSNKSEDKEKIIKFKSKSKRKVEEEEENHIVENEDSDIPQEKRKTLTNILNKHFEALQMKIDDPKKIDVNRAGKFTRDKSEIAKKSEHLQRDISNLLLL